MTEEEKFQQSHRQKTVEESASEIDDVNLSPKVVIIGGLVLLIVILLIGVKVIPTMLEDKNPLDLSKPVEPVKTDPKGAKIVTKPALPTVKIKTSLGDITVELFEDDTPNTVANFIELCQRQFYDNIRFHRVKNDFMIQVGCPNAKGKVGPNAGSGSIGYSFKDEFRDKLKFDKKYLLAMANSGANTNSSQFFITDALTTGLNGRHTIFGKVIDGVDIVEKISEVPTYKSRTSTKPQDAPIDDVYIISTEIKQLRDHEYKVKKIN